MRAAPMAPDDRRAQLLGAARAVFARRGYHAAGVADIIAEAGVARGTFYNYFPSKRAVFAAVLDAVMAELDRAVRPIDVAEPIGPQVRDNFLRVVRALTDPEVTRLLFAEAHGLDAEADEALRAFYEGAVARVSRALHTGRALGIVRDGDLDLTARCLLGMVKEPAIEAALAGESLDAARLVDEILRILTEGMLRLDPRAS